MAKNKVRKLKKAREQARAEKMAAHENANNYDYMSQVEANKVIALLSPSQSPTPPDNVIEFVPKAGNTELSDIHGNKLTSSASTAKELTESVNSLSEPSASSSETIETVLDTTELLTISNISSSNASSDLLLAICSDIKAISIVYGTFLLVVLVFLQEALLMGFYTLLILVSMLGTSWWLVSIFWGWKTPKYFKF